jgi:hypothetical protein
LALITMAMLLRKAGNGFMALQIVTLPINTRESRKWI